MNPTPFYEKEPLHICWFEFLFKRLTGNDMRSLCTCLYARFIIIEVHRENYPTVLRKEEKQSRNSSDFVYRFDSTQKILLRNPNLSAKWRANEYCPCKNIHICQVVVLLFIHVFFHLAYIDFYWWQKLSEIFRFMWKKSCCSRLVHILYSVEL